jgi:hypothetical protein
LAALHQLSRPAGSSRSDRHNSVDIDNDNSNNNCGGGRN